MKKKLLNLKKEIITFLIKDGYHFNPKEQICVKQFGDWYITYMLPSKITDKDNNLQIQYYRHYCDYKFKVNYFTFGKCEARCTLNLNNINEFILGKNIIY